MGGGPCLIIINEGGRAYGAIEQYKSGGGASDTSILEAAVLTSCSLVQYGAVEKRLEGEYLEGQVLDKVGEFHKRVIENIGKPDYNVNAEALKLEKYNRKICNLVEPGTYPE